MSASRKSSQPPRANLASRLRPLARPRLAPARTKRPGAARVSIAARTEAASVSSWPPSSKAAISIAWPPSPARPTRRSAWSDHRRGKGMSTGQRRGSAPSQAAFAEQGFGGGRHAARPRKQATHGLKASAAHRKCRRGRPEQHRPPRLTYRLGDQLDRPAARRDQPDRGPHGCGGQRRLAESPSRAAAAASRNGRGLAEAAGRTEHITGQGRPHRPLRRP